VLKRTRKNKLKKENKIMNMSLLSTLSRITNKVENLYSRKGSLQVTSLEAIGLLNGTNAITPVDPNYLVTTTAMKVGAYTIAAQPKGSHVVTVTHTKVAALDTLGIITVVGTDSDGAAVTEIITPTDSATVTGLLGFETITSITGSGWVITGADNDTLVVGVGAIMPPVGKYIYKITCETTAVVASETFVSGSAGPKLSSLTGLVAGHAYYGSWSSITMTSGEAIAYYNVL